MNRHTESHGSEQRNDAMRSNDGLKRSEPISAADDVRAINNVNTELTIVKARWFVIAFLFLYNNIMHLAGWPVSLVNGLLAVASIYNSGIGLYIKRTRSASRRPTSLYLFCDIAAVALALFFTNGVHSPLLFLWYLTLFAAGVRLGYWRSLFLQVPMGVFYTLLLMRDSDIFGHEFMNRLILGLFSITATALYGAIFSRERQYTVQRLDSYHRESITDRLTGLFNYAYFMDELKREHARAIRTRGHFSLIIYDIDFFKHVNDTYGHEKGNVLLKKIADILQANARQMDTVARYGGEEFVVLMPLSNGKEREIAERTRKKIESEEFTEIAERPLKITISGGICTYPRDAKTIDELLDKADRGLYQAKTCGRNKTSYCEPMGG
jgi:diguanylate cyclase (GGDEF)-like protein